ncbi:hypothetical protein ACQEVZ_39405 [Dactylosporangium sp. CA-152071]|uniref:hypothetical protein n=1 Tax=Dactylosporangium sp. CA-152071 TaxID=3239933 RepID=UPI003D8E687F
MRIGAVVVRLTALLAVAAGVSVVAAAPAEAAPPIGKLYNSATDTCLVVSGVPPYKLRLAEGCSSDLNFQMWYFVWRPSFGTTSDGYKRWALRHQRTGLCLAVWSGFDPEVPVVSLKSDCNAAEVRLDGVGNSLYNVTLRNTQPGATGGSHVCLDAGVRAMALRCNYGDNQRWRKI